MLPFCENKLHRAKIVQQRIAPASNAVRRAIFLKSEVQKTRSCHVISRQRYVR